MKKATFLLFFVAMMFALQPKDVHAEEFQFTDFTISLDEQLVNGEGRIIVTKGGINPFQTTIGVPGMILKYEGVKTYQNHFIVYGYTIGGLNQRDYSGFYFILDEAGEIIQSDVINEGHLETVQDVYQLGDLLILEIVQVIDNDYGVIVLKHQFLVFDSSYNLLQEYNIEDSLKSMNIESDMLLGRYQAGTLYDFGILSDGSLMWKNDEIGVIDQAVYYGEVCLTSINPYVLNNETVQGSTCVDIVGAHYIQHNQQSSMFYIEPTIDGVEDGAIYYESVSIASNGGYMTLNGDNYTNHEEISNIGRYILVIEGANNYQKEVHFEIGAVVEGITNNTTYEDAVTISFTGQGYLNNQFVKSPVTVENTGEYIFKIKGTQGYIESYYFEITEASDQVGVVDFIQKVDVFILGAVLVFGLFIVKKKK